MDAGSVEKRPQEPKAKGKAVDENPTSDKRITRSQTHSGRGKRKGGSGGWFLYRISETSFDGKTEEFQGDPEDSEAARDAAGEYSNSGSADVQKSRDEGKGKECDDNGGDDGCGGGHGGNSDGDKNDDGKKGDGDGPGDKKKGNEEEEDVEKEDEEKKDNNYQASGQTGLEDTPDEEAPRPGSSGFQPASRSRKRSRPLSSSSAGGQSPRLGFSPRSRTREASPPFLTPLARGQTPRPRPQGGSQPSSSFLAGGETPRPRQTRDGRRVRRPNQRDYQMLATYRGRGSSADLGDPRLVQSRWDPTEASWLNLSNGATMQWSVTHQPATYQPGPVEQSVKQSVEQSDPEEHDSLNYLFPRNLLLIPDRRSPRDVMRRVSEWVITQDYAPSPLLQTIASFSETSSSTSPSLNLAASPTFNTPARGGYSVYDGITGNELPPDPPRPRRVTPSPLSPAPAVPPRPDVEGSSRPGSPPPEGDLDSSDTNRYLPDSPLPDEQDMYPLLFFPPGGPICAINSPGGRIFQVASPGPSLVVVHRESQSIFAVPPSNARFSPGGELRPFGRSYGCGTLLPGLVSPLTRVSPRAELLPAPPGVSETVYENLNGMAGRDEGQGELGSAEMDLDGDESSSDEAMSRLSIMGPRDEIGSVEGDLDEGESTGGEGSSVK